MADEYKILKDFGFQFEEKKDINVQDNIVLVIKSGQHFAFKKHLISKISSLITETMNSDEKTGDELITLPPLIDIKFMLFLVDYVNFIEKNGIPVYQVKAIEAATTLENAIGPQLYGLFEKHFNYKFMRSDLSVKNYLEIFGHFLKCATLIISDPLITLFAIAHKIIIQHLPSSEFIITD